MVSIIILGTNGARCLSTMIEQIIVTLTSDDLGDKGGDCSAGHDDNIKTNLLAYKRLELDKQASMPVVEAPVPEPSSKVAGFSGHPTLSVSSCNNTN